MPASGSTQEPKLFPNRVMEDQDMEMKPTVLGPIPFSSPNPETDGVRFKELTDEQIAGLAGEKKGLLKPDEMNAGDFIKQIKDASTQEELDAVASLYADGDRELKSVESAIEKKQEELNEANS